MRTYIGSCGILFCSLWYRHSYLFRLCILETEEDLGKDVLPLLEHVLIDALNLIKI